MKKILLLAFNLIIIQFSFAQLAFNSAFSLGNNANDQGVAIAADASGNYYCTGFATYWMNANPLGTPYYTTNNGGEDIYVAKYNSSGIMQWAFDIGSTGDDAPLKIALDAGSNVYVAGRFTATVDFDPGAGTATRTSNGGTDIFLVKFDSNGNFQWVNTFGGVNNEQAWDVTTDATSTNVIITGGYLSPSMNMDPSGGTQIITNNGHPGFGVENCFVAAYSEFSGSYQWAFNIGGFNGATGHRVVTDNAGNIYVGGVCSNDTLDFDPGPNLFWSYPVTGDEIFLAKYNSLRIPQWVNRYGGVYGETANSLAVDNNGGVYQGGYFNSDSMDVDPGAGTYYLHNYPNGVQDIYVVKFNSSSGSLNWAFAVGGSYSETAQDLVLDNAGHFYITGNYGSTVDFDPGPNVHQLTGQLGSDAYLAKYDTAGNFMNVIPFNGNGGTQFGIGLCIIPPNKIGVTGFFSADTIDFDPGPGVYNLFVNGSNPTWTDAFVATYTTGAVGLEENNFPDQFIIYPNPADKGFNVQCSKCHVGGQLKIFDAMGKEIYKTTITTLNIELETLNYPNGIYFIQLSTHDKIYNKKIIISH